MCDGTIQNKTKENNNRFSIFSKLKNRLPRWQKLILSLTFLVILTTLVTATAFFEVLSGTQTTTQREQPPTLRNSKLETLKLPIVQRPVVETVTGSLEQTIDTSLFSPASPDPAGIAYDPVSDRLILVDSEVDETTGAGYHGVNMWLLTRNGTVTNTGTTLAWGGITNDEPTGVDYDPATNTLFVSTDQPSASCRIYMAQSGADGRFGTADDGQRYIHTNPIIGTASPDTEDPVFDPATGHLFFLNGQTSPVNPQVYRIDPVNGIFGDGDDVSSYFNIGNGAIDAEGLTIDQARDTLLVGVLLSPGSTKMIYEFTKDGNLIRTINATGISGLKYLSGLTMAPASNGSGRWNIWIVDRGVDNDSVPTENDGKLFEISVPMTGNTPPVVTSVTVSPANPKTTDTLTAAVSGRDDDGDPLTYTYQWLKNGTNISGETNSTLVLSVAGNGDKGDVVSVRVTAADGTATSTPRTSAAVKIVNSAPVLDLPDLSNAEGAIVSVSAAASDPDNDPLTYSAVGLPTGLSIDPATGLITGTIPAGARTGSPYPAAVTVRDAQPSSVPPIVQVQAITANSTSSSTSVTLTYSLRPSEGNLLIAEGRFGNSRIPTMPAGWQLAVMGNNSPRTVVFYKIAGPNEPQSVTLQASGTASSMSLTLFEYSGLSSDQSTVLDQAVWNTAPDLSLSISSGTIPLTTQADELLIAGVHLGGTRTFNNSWTNGFIRQISANQHSFAHRIVSATGNFETTESWLPHATNGTGTTAAMTLVSFKGAGSTAEPGAEVTDNFLWIITPPAVDLSVSADTGSEAAATSITVTATASAQVSGDQTVNLSVSGTNITVADYTLNSQVITIPNGTTTGTATFTIVDDELVEGTETASLTVSEPSQGIVLGAFTVRNITIIDNDLPPTTTINSFPPDPSNDSSPTFTFSGTKPSGTANTEGGSFESTLSFECRLSPDIFVTCTSPKTFSGLADGVHTFEVRAIDNAGNIDPTPAFYNWLIHTEMPVIEYVPLSSTSSISDIPLNVAVTDGLGVNWVSVRYSVNGTEFLSNPCTGSGPFNCTIPGNDVGTAVAYYVEACDMAGNVKTDVAPLAPNLFTVGPAQVPVGTYSHMAISNGSTLGGDVFVIEDLALGGVIATGEYTLSIDCPGTITGADAGGKYVNGNLQKSFCTSPATFTFPIGENGYTPVSVIVTDLTTNPSSLTIRSYDAGLDGFDPLESLSRNWQINENGDLTATLSFSYLPEDVSGNEANYRVWRRQSNGADTDMCLAPCVNIETHVIGPVSGVTIFSRWIGSGPLVPTAADVSLSGHVLTSDGNGVRNATVTISGGGLTEPISILTGPFGFYKFDGLRAGETYVVSVRSRRFTFTVANRVITATDNTSDIDFTADP